MKNTEKQLISILSAFVNSTEPDIKTEYSAAELYELAKKQSVTGIVSYILKKYDRDDIISQDKRLELAFDKTVTQFVRKELDAEKLMAKLSEAQIPHITFKGLVVKQCYPVPELRTYGDVDLIIRHSDRAKCHKLMVEMGYDYKVTDGGQVYAYTKGKEFFEIHTTLNSERTKLSERMNNYWDSTILQSGYTYEFEKNFHLSYLISHIEKHVYDTGAGLRMYLDIALYLKEYGAELDLEKVRSILSECRLDKFFDTVLYLCRRWFGSAVEPQHQLSEEVYREYCRVVLRGGTFGVQKKDGVSSDEELRKAMNSDGKVNKFTLVMRHVFPSYAVVRKLYPFFNGKPVLLPAAWVVHLVDAGKRSGFSNIKTVLQGDVSKAQRDKQLLEQIGSSRE